MKIRLSIKAKILMALLLLSLATFSTVTALALINLKRLSIYAIEISSSLGKSAVRDSQRALLDQAREELRTLVTGQAAISNLQLQRLANETGMFSSLVGRYFEDKYRQPDFVPKDTGKYFRKKLTAKEKAIDFSTYFIVQNADVKLQRKQLDTSKSLYFIMKYMLRSNQSQDLIYLGMPSGLFIGYPWHQVPDKYDPRNRQWYTNAVAAKGETTWSGPYVSASNNKLVLTCSKAVYDDKGKLLAVCGIDLDVNRMVKKFLSSQLNTQCFSFMIDGKGRLLSAQGMVDHGLKWNKEYRTMNLLKTGNLRLTEVVNKMIDGEAGLTRIHLDGGSIQYMAYAPVPATKWSIGIMIPRRQIVASSLETERMITRDTMRHNRHIDRYLINNQMIYFCVGIILLAVIIIVGMVLSRKITDPILYLKQQAIEIGSVNLGKRIELKTGDELEQLADTFNRMTQDLKDYIINLGETVAAKEKMQRELGVAYEIQTSMLPSIFPPFPQCPDVDIFALMEPAKEVGGDFYDFFMIDDRFLYFCIGDVSGKGVPAALFMAIAKTLLGHEAGRPHDPSEILKNVNNAIEKDNDACMFATAFSAIMDTRTGEIQFSNAGHNPPLVYRKGLGFSFLDPEKGIPLGVCYMQDGVCRKEEILLGRGDILFLYSDGVTEAMNENGIMFGESRILEELNKVVDQPLKDMLTSVRQVVRNHAGLEPQSDDITMMVIKRGISV